MMCYCEGNVNHFQENTRALNLYLQEIARFPKTTKEEEIELAFRIKEGDESATTRLIEGNLRFVVFIARKYYSRRLTLLDIINEGNLGLIEAARRIRLGMNNRFVTYAVWWIRQYINRALAEHNYVVKLPEKTYVLGKQLDDATRNDRRMGERKLSLSELAGSLGVDEETIRNLMCVTKKCLPLELHIHQHSKNSEQWKTVIPRQENFEEIIINKIFVSEIIKLMNSFDSRAITIFLFRHGLLNGKTLTLESLGRKFGLSKEGVRQIDRKVLKRLRNSL